MNPYQNQHKSVPNSMIQSSNNSPINNTRNGQQKPGGKVVP